MPPAADKGDMQRLALWLQIHAAGHLRACRVPDIARALGWTCSYTRAVASDLAEACGLVGSCPAGLFWIESGEDRTVALRYLRPKAMKVLRRMRGLRLAQPGRVQMSLEVE